MSGNIDQFDTLVQLENLSFSYPDQPIYKDLTLGISRSKVTAVMGPSGCGKSTLLSLIVGRLEPNAGNVYFDGISLVTIYRVSFSRIIQTDGLDTLILQLKRKTVVSR